MYRPMYIGDRLKLHLKLLVRPSDGSMLQSMERVVHTGPGVVERVYQPTMFHPEMRCQYCTVRTYYYS